MGSIICLFKYCLFAIFLFACAPSSEFLVDNRSWPPPYNDLNTLGGALEPEFQQLLDRCNIYAIDESAIRTSIPPLIRTELDLDADIKTQDRDAVERLLRYMFLKPDFDSYESRGTQWEFRGETLNINQLPTPIDLSTSTLFYQNCSTILAAAVEGNLNPPLLSFEAGAKASVKQKSGIGLVEGTFRSPLSLGLLKSAPFSVRFPLLLEVWQWYLDNPTAADTTIWYIDQFVGVAQIDYSESETEQDISLKSEANVNFGPSSFGFQTSVESGIGARLNSTGYKTHIYLRDDKSDEVTFAELPKPESIVEVIAKAEPTFLPGSSKVFQQGALHTLSYSISQLPLSFCDESYWNSNPTGISGIININSITPQSTGRNGLCIFQFSYQPGNNVSIPENLFIGSIELISEDIYKIGDNQLVLHFPIRLPTTDKPKLIPIGGMPDWTRSSTSVTWRYPIEILSSVPIDGNVYPNLLNEEEFGCSSGISFPVNTQIIPGEGSVFTLEISTPNPQYLEGRVDGSGPVEYCEFSAIADIPINDAGTTVPRPLNVQLPFPIPNQSSSSIPSEISTEDRVLSYGNNSGIISRDDVQLEDGTYIQAWDFIPNSSDSIRINVKSEDFDPWIFVTGNEILIENDDKSSTDLSSELIFEVTSNEVYTIYITSWRANNFGSYTVEINID